MTLKFKISLFVSLLITLLFGIASAIIILLFANFRKEEFQRRLEQKALTTIKLLLEVKQVDSQLLKAIDQNSLNKLFDEKVILFNADHEVIYTSIDDISIHWTPEDLEYLKRNKRFFRKEGQNEICGVFYDTSQKDYYALISANDNLGKSRLQYLIFIVIATSSLLIIVAWLLCFFTTRKLLRPLDYFQQTISRINEHNLGTRLPVKPDSNFEIDLIAKEFNYLLIRLQDGYQKQKEFTAHASHELRTPLARISSQLENHLLEAPPEVKPRLRGILQNVNQLNQLVYSLLIVSKVEKNQAHAAEHCRIDETIYNSIDKVHAESGSFAVQLNIDAQTVTEEMLSINGNAFLLETVFYNLLKNAHLYSADQQAHVDLYTKNGRLAVAISNNGEPLSAAEQEHLFEPFMRGSNSSKQTGFGLGLKIVHRILSYYGYGIVYEAVQRQNRFIISF